MCRTRRSGWSAYGVALPEWEELVKGAIIGVVDVVDCVRAEEMQVTPWALGPWCWVLANPKPVTPVPYKGNQMIFTIPDKLLAEDCCFRLGGQESSYPPAWL